MESTIEIKNLAQQIYEILEIYESYSYQDLYFTNHIFKTTIENIIEEENGYVDKIVKQIDEYLQNSELFKKDIMFFNEAMKYLKQYDSGLVKSLAIASKYGYDIDHLNSTILASLLQSEMAREEYMELWPNIQEAIEDLDFDSITENEVKDKYKTK